MLNSAPISKGTVCVFFLLAIYISIKLWPFYYIKMLCLKKNASVWIVEWPKDFCILVVKRVSLRLDSLVQQSNWIPWSSKTHAYLSYLVRFVIPLMSTYTSFLIPCRRLLYFISDKPSYSSPDRWGTVRYLLWNLFEWHEDSIYVGTTSKKQFNSNYYR